MRRYLACQQGKQRIIDLMTLAVAEMGDQPNGQEVLMELWRCVNLCNLATYCLADKTRTVYSFGNFLLPVSEAFGLYDGQELVR